MESIDLLVDATEADPTVEAFNDLGIIIESQTIDADLGFDGVDGNVVVSFTISLTAQVLGGLLVEYLKARGIESAKSSPNDNVNADSPEAKPVDDTNVDKK
ncbi:MAG: hypothetical protein EOO88_51770 [Pedobacter sp.]|nr:MAG: hypothetical protein EOO88_51770 [Pedobacter sp.]